LENKAHVEPDLDLVALHLIVFITIVVVNNEHFAIFTNWDVLEHLLVNGVGQNIIAVSAHNLRTTGYSILKSIEGLLSKHRHIEGASIILFGNRPLSVHSAETTPVLDEFL